uniref:Methyltransferase domain-containing protein n=1 Tax=Chromera velia CCMP2878 TaxID=1169474 RepID=A0A0G4GAW9_9ALVE|eukprot:Cvel_21082.t1-p1 / transcript=Cvel_21082.t1 / gene=Cvel_21082 / organism=Chromera_velia_CCMP2878 / gene_product=hypothetical protein / transcript_product=hypothetical protein / location=Cvel_scaffold1949:10120-10998(+) / protein_length=293 / sequence_SO=supercontig / SO=protein_coding / is_pseudo=false
MAAIRVGNPSSFVSYQKSSLKSSNPSAAARAGVKKQEKKEHFDDIYTQETPVLFKEKILDGLDYKSDNYNKTLFDRSVLPLCRQIEKAGGIVQYVDLCCCFGNTTLACVNGMSVDEIRDSWRDEQICFSLDKPRRFSARTLGIDISTNALDYGKTAGIFDSTIACDLNKILLSGDTPQHQELVSSLASADVLVAAAALVYLDLQTIDALLSAFSASTKPGLVLVNFLNPFNLEKADKTKRLLLQHLHFVSSQATQHRLLSPMERQNFPGEEWAHLELWVLSRRPAAAEDSGKD